MDHKQNKGVNTCVMLGDDREYGETKRKRKRKIEGGTLQGDFEKR